MLEGLLYLAQFPLNLPGHFFDFAPRLQAAIVGQFSRFLLDRALDLITLPPHYSGLRSAPALNPAEWPPPRKRGTPGFHSIFPFEGIRAPAFERSAEGFSDSLPC